MVTSNRKNVCTAAVFSVIILAALLYSAGVLYAAGHDTIRARVVFFGDIMAHDQQLEAARDGSSWNFKPQFFRVKPLLWNALSVGNLETVFAGTGRRFAGYPSFNTPDDLADALVDFELDVVMLANNHILDHGLDAALRTTKVLDEKGLAWTGLSRQDNPYEPLIIEYGGLKWAFVNYSYGTNAARQITKPEHPQLNIISEEAIINGLRLASAQEPDVTVAYFHWGAEYQYAPSRSQRRAAELCLQNGADLVIGAHPHVLQPIEITNSDKGHALVAYSLGNFVSYQRTIPRERSVVLAADVEKKPGGRAELSRVSVAPIWVSARRVGGHRRIEVVYSGTGGPFNHEGLPARELAAARNTGAIVLDFLGASAEPDEEGFYTIWDAASPHDLPVSRRPKPE